MTQQDTTDRYSDEHRREEETRRRQAVEERGEGLVAAALAGDAKAARRHTDFFVLGNRVDEGIPYWERAVEAGDAFSAFTLGRYRKIRGDRREAERIYRTAADRDSGCAYGLAVLLQEDGDPEATEWFRTGWEMGHLDCKIELGKLLAAEGKPAEAAQFLMRDVGIGDIAVFGWVQRFEGIRKTFDQAAENLEAAEVAGDGEAAQNALEPLRGMTRDFKDFPGLVDEALEYYRKAARTAPEALAELALFIEQNHPDDRWPEVRENLERSYAAGVPEAALLLGNLNEERGELAEAERWYAEAAGAGLPAGRSMIADLLSWLRRLDEAEQWLDGLETESESDLQIRARIDRFREEDEVPPDADLSRLPELRERADAGDAQAAYEYGDLLFAYTLAEVRWMVPLYEPAAREGNPQAAYVLSQFYQELGEPTKRDQWKRVAAEAGHHAACTEMATLSEHHRDYQEAERWRVRAAADDSPLSAFYAGKLIAQRGAYEQAEPYLHKAWEEGRDLDFGTEAAGYFGLVLHRTGRHQEALDPLELASEYWRDDVRSRYPADDLEIMGRLMDPTAELAAAREALAGE